MAPIPGWDWWPEFVQDLPVKQTFQGLRSEAGEEMILKNNIFVEKLFPFSIQREMTPEEMEEYIRPFKEPGESRRPTLTWPREIAIRGDGPQEMIDIEDAYNKWLSKSKDLPKLLIDAQPGFFAPLIRELTTDWPNLQVAQAPGLHFLQEDSPDQIGQAIKEFLTTKVFYLQK